MTENCPTLANIADECRSILSDMQVPGGRVYSNDILTRPIKSAVRKAYSLLRSIGGFQTSRVGYCKLPAHQTVLMKQSTGLLDLLVPIAVARRFNVTFRSATAVSKNGRNLEVTVDGDHGIPVGQYGYVTLTDIPGYPLANGMFNSLSTSSTTLTILGCDVTGSFAEDSSKVNLVGCGTEMFADMSFNTETGGLIGESVLPTGIDYRPKWSFQGGVFNFSPQDSDVQLRVQYYSTGNMPESLDDVVEIPGSIDFLAHYAVMEATTTRMPTVSKTMYDRCFGAGSETRAEDGLARDLFREVYKTHQNKRYEDKTRPGYGAARLPWQRILVG